MFVNLLTVLILVVGVMTLKSLNLDVFPNVALDLVRITTDYPGATPHEIEKLITIPLEKELKEVDDIKEMLFFLSHSHQTQFIIQTPGTR